MKKLKEIVLEISTIWVSFLGCYLAGLIENILKGVDEIAVYDRTNCRNV